MPLMSAVLTAVLAGTPDAGALAVAQEGWARAEEQSALEAEQGADAEAARAREQARRAQEDEKRQRDQEKEVRLEEAYERATEALDDGEWDRAAKLFDRVADSGGRRVDGALYWKAYAWHKLARRAEALAAIEALRSGHPQSRWLKEARALELEIRQQSGTSQPPQSMGGDEELQILALNGIMNSNPEQAVPMLERFLDSTTSPKLQDRALFVLMQSRSPRGREIVAQIARGKSHPHLQRKAIRYLGLFGGEESRQALEQIYADSGDESVKKAVLQGFMVSGRKAPVLAAAKGEKDPGLRRAAVHTLGVMGAKDELWSMYQAEGDRDVRKGIIHALFVGGAQDRMMELARGEKDPELRRDAVHKLGLMGAGTAEALVAIYKSESDRELREAVLHGLFLQGNGRAMVEIARAEKDPELRKRAVHHLSLMSSKEGTEFLLELLDKK
jgi:hypothetical protein